MIKLRHALAACIIAIGIIVTGPTTAQSPPADALAAAKDLFAVMKLDEQYKAMLPLILQQLKPMIVQGRPEVERDYDAIIPALSAAANARFGEITSLSAALYATHFTAAELRDVAGFYRTPTGQKFLQKLPSIAQESFAIGQRFGQTLLNDLQSQMKQELRTRGHNI
jgi:hypothetical protein